MTKQFNLQVFFSLTQLSYFFMIHLVIFSSEIMQKSTYISVRLKVLVKNKVRCLGRIIRKHRNLYYYNYVNISNLKKSSKYRSRIRTCITKLCPQK